MRVIALVLALCLLPLISSAGTWGGCGGNSKGWCYTTTAADANGHTSTGKWIATTSTVTFAPTAAGTAYLRGPCTGVTATAAQCPRLRFADIDADGLTDEVALSSTLQRIHVIPTGFYYLEFPTCLEATTLSIEPRVESR